MIRKMLFTLSLTAAVLGLSATSAFALDCMNLSRPAPAQPTAPLVVGGGDQPTIWVVQGDWWYISFDGFAHGFWDKVPPGTGNFIGLTAADAAALGLPAGVLKGNYQAGQGFGLLDNAQAPCNASRQTTHGIQADSIRCT